MVRNGIDPSNNLGIDVLSHIDIPTNQSQYPIVAIHELSQSMHVNVPNFEVP